MILGEIGCLALVALCGPRGSSSRPPDLGPSIVLTEGQPPITTAKPGHSPDPLQATKNPRVPRRFFGPLIASSLRGDFFFLVYKVGVLLLG